MLSNTQAAQYAALIMYAWNMCNPDLHCQSPAPDPRLVAIGWRVIGYVTGSDYIISSEPDTKTKMLGACLAAKDQVCYGYLASNAADEVVVVIRGTDGALEWLDDFDFFPRPPDFPLKGLVEGGFYSIYKSMCYHPVNDKDSSVPLAVGVAGVTSLTVTVLGHSLGAALGTYLTADLAMLKNISTVSACLFASPKPGNSAFAAYFASNVTEYWVFNYIEDIVPLVPPVGYASLPGCTILTNSHPGVKISSDKVCCHHLICYIALLDPEFYEQLIIMPQMTSNDKACAACVTVHSTI